MWVYSNIRESETPIRIFEYKPTRAGYNPERFLKDFKGKVITDGYSGYNNLPGVTNVYCWAHARRKFRDAIPSDIKDVNSTLAKQGLDKISRLFAVESEIDKLSPEEKVKVRQNKSKPILDEFFEWCDKHQDEVLSKSKISQAFKYALNHRKGLSEYINDGLLPMTNSLDERTIRPFAVGRKTGSFQRVQKGQKPVQQYIAL